MKESLFKVFYHYNNIPKILRKPMTNWFMGHHNAVAKIFNEAIDGVNKEWRKTGEPFSFGEYLEDVNPAYVKYIQNAIQPIIDDAINQKSMVFKFKIDEYGDIVGYIPFINNSKLFISLKLREL